MVTNAILDALPPQIQDSELPFRPKFFLIKQDTKVKIQKIQTHRNVDAASFTPLFRTACN